MNGKKSILWGFGLTAACVLFVVGAVPAPAQTDIRGVHVVPDEEKRSSFQEADGYVYLGGDTTLNDAKAQALAEAKRNAAEAAVTYIRSNTKVENFEVKYDVIVSQAEAAVRVVKMIDHGIVDNARYRMWINAEVFYELQPKTDQPDLLMLMDEEAPLTVRVWTDKKRFKKGEHIDIHMRGNKDFHAKIVARFSTGELVQLLPNEFRNEHHFKGGVTYTVPGEGDRFNLEVGPPYGKDRIIVYASEVELGSVPLEKYGEGGLLIYRSGEQELAEGVRGIYPVYSESKDKPQGVPSVDGAPFYEASWEVFTHE